MNKNYNQDGQNKYVSLSGDHQPQPDVKMTSPSQQRKLLRQNITKQNPPATEPSASGSVSKLQCQNDLQQHDYESLHMPTGSSQPFVPSQHDFLITTIIHLNEQLMLLAKRMEDMQNRLAAAQQSNPEVKRKKLRRKAQQIEKNSRCPYPGCMKSYGSEVSLNLHIKLKHNCNNKAEREQYMTVPSAQKQKLAGSSVPTEHPKFSLPPQIMRSIEQQYQMLNRKLNH